MKKVFFIFVPLLFLGGSLYAQYDPQISLYTFFPAAINPAMVGQSDMMQVVGLHRMQYMSMNGGQTTNIGVNAPFKLGKATHGAGIRFVNRTVGLYSNMNGYLQYAYKHKSAVGEFSFGVDVGFQSIGFDGTKVNLDSITLGEYHNLSDDKFIPTTEVSGTALDLNIGALYSFTNGYVGISYAHATQPSVTWDDYNNIKMPGMLYIMGTYGFSIPDTKLVIRPQTLFKSDLIVWNMDLGSKLEYDDRLWGGLSFSIGDYYRFDFASSITFMFGMNIFGGLAAAVCYEMPTNRMIQSIGSFEVGLEYNFQLALNKQTKKYKSIRIL